MPSLLIGLWIMNRIISSDITRVTGHETENNVEYRYGYENVWFETQMFMPFSWFLVETLPSNTRPVADAKSSLSHHLWSQ